MFVDSWQRSQTWTEDVALLVDCSLVFCDCVCSDPRRTNPLRLCLLLFPDSLHTTLVKMPALRRWCIPRRRSLRVARWVFPPLLLRLCFHTLTFSGSLWARLKTGAPLRKRRRFTGRWYAWFYSFIWSVPLKYHQKRCFQTRIRHTDDT